MRLPATLALSLALLPPASAAQDAPPKAVRLRTRDGLSLEADWYGGGAGMPGIVGLHMYPADRASWKPLAEKRPEGFHFLAVDLRGYGGSRMQGGRDLSEGVKKRDNRLFQAMWQDAEAAVKFLREEAKCDARRIGLAGASVGCSIAVDTAVRDGKIAGAVCLSPGTNYFEIPTIDHVKSWPAGTALLLASPEGEAAGGTRPLGDALKDRPGVEVRNWPGDRDLHGTRSFGKVAGLEGALANWFAAVLGREVLDAFVDPCEEACTPVSGFCSAADPGSGEFRTFRFRLGIDAKGVSFSGEGPEGRIHPPGIELRIDPAEAGEAPVEGSRRLRGEASAEGTLLRAWLDTRKGGKWSEQPLGSLPGAALVRGRVLEARVPWGVLGVKPGSAIWIRLRLANQDMPVPIGPAGMKVPE